MRKLFIFSLLLIAISGINAQNRKLRGSSSNSVLLIYVQLPYSWLFRSTFKMHIVWIIYLLFLICRYPFIHRPFNELY